MRFVIACVAVALVTAIPTVRAADDTSALLLQVQAADVLSDMLTYTLDRADARVAAMQEFLRSIDKENAYLASATKPPAGSPVYFAQVFQGAVAFVKDGDGAKYTDPTLKGLNESQLLSHLTLLQAYNVDQFRKVNEARQSSSAMAKYLDSIDQFDAYLKWAKAKAPAGASASQADAKTPEEIAAAMEKAVSNARDVAWKKAQAMGISQQEFDKRWDAHVKEFKETVAQRIAGVNALAGSLGKTELAGSASATPPPAGPGAVPVKSPVIWQTTLHVIQPPPGPALPPPVNSKYTNAYFSAQDDRGMWNNWDDGYGDVHHHH